MTLHHKYGLFIAFGVGLFIGWEFSSELKTIPGLSQLNASLNPQNTA